MPERDNYPKRLFTDNPFEGETPEEAYKRLQWGNDPESTFELLGPEDMIALGDLAMVDTEAGVMVPDEPMYVAVGMESNRLYFIYKDEDGGPVEIGDSPEYEAEGLELYQTDYESRKGGDDCYYYHEHEDPWPTLVASTDGTHFVVLPEDDEGARSYAVSVEGIIG